MRSRERILQSLESVYREAFTAAKERDDRDAMGRLDLEYQRDQLHLEVLMDVRELLGADTPPEEKGPSILERAQALKNLKNLTKLR